MARVFCDTYYSSEQEEAVREWLEEEYETEPTDDEVFNAISFENECDIDEAIGELDRVFESSNILVFGAIQRWNGSSTGFSVYDSFAEAFDELTEDCDCVKIWEEKGHLLLQCSHHDGTNMFEFKALTQKGIDYLQNWEYEFSSNRTNGFIKKQLVTRYSRLPKFSD